MYEYKAVILGHEDNGVVHVDVDLGLGVQRTLSLPLHGIRITEPESAVEMLDQDLPPGTGVILTAHPVEGGAWTVTLYHEGQSMNVNDMLVAEGHAVSLTDEPSGKAGK